MSQNHRRRKNLHSEESLHSSALELMQMTEPQAILQKLHGTIRQLGFNDTGFGFVDTGKPLAPIAFVTLPPQWTEIRDWPNNPLLKKQLIDQSVVIHPHIDEVGKQEKPFYEALASIGAAQGLSVSIKHGNIICVVGAMRDRQSISDKERTFLEPRMRLLNAVTFCAFAPCLHSALQMTRGVHLTMRQRQVLQCAVAGMSVRETASALNISIETVRQHQNDAKMRLGARTLMHAVAMALKSHLI